jgi:hypothetical protein
MVPLTLLLLSALSPVPDDAPTALTEMLSTNVPDEFMTGYHARNAAQEMTELVVAPETVENWSRLITLQLFFGVAQRGTVDGFYGLWRDSMRRACAGLNDTMVRGTVDGHPAIKGVLSCPINPQTGKPENLAAVLVQGEVNMMMVQVAFRRPVAAADTALIERVSGSLKVCDQRTLQACAQRKAIGFRPEK